MMRTLCTAALVVIVAMSIAPEADGYQRIDWRDLTFPVEPQDDPFFGLDYDQRRHLETILDVARRRQDGLVVTEDDLLRQDRARDALRREGLDSEELTKKYRELPDKIARQRHAIRTEWRSVDVRIPGYVIPLEFSGTEVVEFLLVPYVGACIHTPPPPANQIIHVTSERGVKLEGLFQAVWVNGHLKIDKSKREAQLSDGTAGFEIGYSLDAHSVQLYRK